MPNVTYNFVKKIIKDDDKKKIATLINECVKCKKIYTS